MGAWQEIVDYTVPSNTTSVVLDSFGTITKDDFVKVVTTIVSTSSSFYTLFPTSNSTSTNYHSQLIQASASSVSAVRFNQGARIGFTATTNTNITYLKLSENDRYNIFTNSTISNDSSIRTYFEYSTSSGATFSSGITSLTLLAEKTDDVRAGTRIQIYKLAAEKVADITVGSNTTQVDISNLSIDKDSEYLLVSDQVFSASGRMYLNVNGNTTLSNYYSQTLVGFGSSPLAGRFNESLYNSQSSGNGLLYTHIKLSNIGAYTSQTYGIRFYGSSSVDVHNSFISSTAENITSITSLNITSQASNGIGAGSRFQLYKLY